MNQSVIVYGPQGCGKTTNAHALAKHFGLHKIVDDGRQLLTEPTGSLYLTNDRPLLAYGCRVISFHDAMEELQP